MRSKTTSQDLSKLQADADELRCEINRLVDVLATSQTKPDAILEGLNERQERLKSIDARLRTIKAAPEAIDFEIHRMMTEARKRLENLQGLLERNGEGARKALATLFEGPLTFTPIQTSDGPRFQIQGNAVVGRVWCQEGAAAAGVSNVASPAGFEPALQP